MKKILYVDDNPDDAEAILRAFKNSDMAVKCVSDVNAALQEKSSDYDVVISDMLMPGDDGLSFAKKFTDSFDISLILTSGVSTLRGFDEYKGLKNYLGFILKPITPEKLNKFLEEKLK